MRRSVEASVPTPPILRLTLQMLDAPDLPALAGACVDGIVHVFGALRARVVDQDRIWAHTCVASDPVAPPTAMRLRLSGTGEAELWLEVELPRGPDLAAVRGQLLDLVAVARRAWKSRRLLDEERRRAREDALTGLDNRLGLDEYLEHAVASARISRTALTVMLVDLDNFKTVNDTHGHAAGDDVLQAAAQCFRRHLRPTDRVCRVGGDEFLLVLPGLPADRAETVAERLRVGFADDPASRGTTMTIGVADVEQLGARDSGSRELVALADRCLYEAKRSGRNCIRRAG